MFFLELLEFIISADVFAAEVLPLTLVGLVQFFKVLNSNPVGSNHVVLNRDLSFKILDVLVQLFRVRILAVDARHYWQDLYKNNYVNTYLVLVI